MWIGKQKPPFGFYGIDPDAAAALGLVAYWPLWEGCGAPTDLVQLSHSALILQGGATWSAGEAGTGLLCNTAGAGAQLTAPAWLKLPLPISFGFWGRPLASAGSNYGLLFNVTYTNAEANPYLSYGIGLNSAGNLYDLFTNDAGGFHELASPMVIGNYLAADIFVAGVVTSAARTLYVDGTVVASGSGQSDPTYGTALLCFGESSYHPSNNNNHIFFGGIISNVAWTADQVVRLAAEPYYFLSGPPGLSSWTPAPATRPFYFNQLTRRRRTG